MRHRSVGGGRKYVRGLRHPLAFGETLRRRCVINREPAARVANSLGLDPQETRGVVRLLASVKFLPSQERMALVAQRDPGFDDDDIGEMFGKTPEWSAEVRERAAEIRKAEPIAIKCEWLTPDLQPFDMTPREILEAAAQARSYEVKARPPRPAIREFSWSGRHASFLPIGS